MYGGSILIDLIYKLIKKPFNLAAARSMSIERPGLKRWGFTASYVILRTLSAPQTPASGQGGCTATKVRRTQEQPCMGARCLDHYCDFNKAALAAAP